MKINELLKTSRELLNLTQKEVSEDIMTESYYSKVERGIHQIDASDFFELLAKNYLSLDIFEGLDNCVFDEYLRENMKEIMTLDYTQVLEKLKNKKLHISVSHRLSLFVHLSTAHPELVSLSSKDKKNFDKKKRKILKSKFNTHLLKQATSCYGLFSAQELLDLAKKSRSYILQHQEFYTIKTYLGFIERFVLSFYTKHLKLNDEVEQELKEVYELCKKLLPHNYGLIDQKISIIIGIDTILYFDTKKDEIKLLQEVLKMTKPNIKLVKGKNNEF